MQDSLFTYSANISIMFTEYPLLDRPKAAAAAGFDHIEMWWPFEVPAAEQEQVIAVEKAIEQAGVALTGLNFYAGNMAGGERGVASHPDRIDQLQANTVQVLQFARATGCRLFNLLYGQRDPRWTPREQDATAIGAIRAAATAVAPLGGTVLLEPLARGLNGDYPFTHPEPVIELLAGPLAELDNVRLLFDVFHLGSNGFDVVGGVADVAPWVGHVQIADAPGRGEPGSGTLPIRESLQALHNAGYAGVVGCEYQPTGRTEDSLGWLTAAA